MHLSRPLTLLLMMGSSSLAASFSLQQLLQTLDHTPAWQNLNLISQQAQQALMAAQAGTQPKLSLGGSYSAGNSAATDPASSAFQQNGSVNVNFSLPVLPWAAAFKGIKTAERSARSSLFDVQDAQNALGSKAIGGYFALQLAQWDVDLARQSLEQAQQQLKNAQQQKELGTLTQEGLLQAQQKATSAQINLQKAQNTLSQNAESLQNTLGMAVPAGEYDSLPQAQLSERTLQDWLALALKSRSDVGKAVLKVEAAQVALQEAQENRWRPAGTVSVSTGFDGLSADASLNWQNGTASTSASYSTSGSQGGYKVSLSASIPILDGSADAEIQIQQLNLQSAQAALQTTQQNAALDVKQKFSNLTISKLQLENALAGLQIAQEHQKVIQARIEAGLSTAGDLSSAQIAVRQAERDQRSAQVAVLTANLELLQATGQNVLGGVL